MNPTTKETSPRVTGRAFADWNALIAPVNLIPSLHYEREVLLQALC
jgi:hypothetical protein